MFGQDPLEEQAGRISDPVERLRYLRSRAPAPAPQASAIAVTVHPLTKSGSKRPWPVRPVTFILSAMGIGAILWAWPAGTPQIEAAQERLVVPGASLLSGPLPAPESVWQVESTETTEVYSNGLRIETAFAVHNRPREPYGIYPLTGSTEPAAHASEPRGIVYHTTESHLVSFEEKSTRNIKRLGRNLLDVLRRERSYHYLIDRFGRAFRVVEETDAANHSGRSVWADSEGIYVNLNDSFIGIAFEAQTEASDQVTAAQITTARQLTELLRSRYKIRPEDCVAHAQVSVNPFNMLIANHSDWAQGLPFAALGLPDNYAVAPPSVYAFGFRYDDAFLKLASTKWPGLDLAEQQIAERARLEGTSETRYRAMLQHRYKQIAAALKEAEMNLARQKPASGGE